MTSGPLIMFAVAALALLLGLLLLLNGRSAGSESKSYARRIGGVMLLALSAILTLFAVTLATLP